MYEAIILAGGLGTRLRKVVPDLPKPMAPINGKPFLEILLRSLSHKGFSRAILSIGYKGDQIVEYFGNYFSNMELVYTFEKQPLGTGGAIKLAISETKMDHAYVFNGDTLVDLEVEDIEQKWNTNQHPIIVGKEVLDTSRYGRLLTDNKRVIGFTEKGIPGKGLINAGCYVITKQLLERFNAQSKFSFEIDYLKTEVKIRHFDLHITSGFFIDIGVPEDFLLAQHLIK